MRHKALPRLRLLLSQLFFVVFVLVFVLSFRVEPMMPAFTGQDPEIAPALVTPSIYDVLWQREGVAKKVLKTGFPLIGYLEEFHSDSTVPSLPLQILGWFMGFTPKSIRDVLTSQLPGSFGGPLAYTGVQSPEIEKDWGITPVLFSLPPGEGAMPVSFMPYSGPLVAVYHTHATESYLPEIQKRDADEAFSADLTKNVVRVGEMLVSELEQKYRIPCLHSKTLHDADTRLGAYYRSEATVKAILQKYPDCKYLIDIHRDSQPKSLTSVTIRGKPYARLMVVIGTDNPNWVSNYSFAKEIIDKLNEGYPGISRGIYYASAVYNQKYSPTAILVEVGGVDNTLAECKNSMEALAWAIASVILKATPQRP